MYVKFSTCDISKTIFIKGTRKKLGVFAKKMLEILYFISTDHPVTNSYFHKRTLTKCRNIFGFFSAWLRRFFLRRRAGSIVRVVFQQPCSSVKVAFSLLTSSVSSLWRQRKVFNFNVSKYFVVHFANQPVIAHTEHLLLC